MRVYTLWQVVLASFLGTALAAGFLTASNIASVSRKHYGWIFFALFAAAHVTVVAINPYSSRLLDTGFFVAETLVLLLINHVFGVSATSRSSRSWLAVIAISIAFLLGWLALVFLVFN